MGICLAMQPDLESSMANEPWQELVMATVFDLMHTDLLVKAILHRFRE